MEPDQFFAADVSKNTRARVLWEISFACTIILAMLLFAVSLN